MTFHDALQYFDSRFKLCFAGALSILDIADSSPAWVVGLRESLPAGDIHCAYRKPQINDLLLTAASDGTGLVPELDPYADLLCYIAGSLVDCDAE